VSVGITSYGEGCAFVGKPGWLYFQIQLILFTLNKFIFSESTPEWAFTTIG
jgi:hypothetical protein